VGDCVVAAVGTSVAGVPQAVNTIVKTIKPAKILNIFVFMFSSLYLIVFVIIRKEHRFYFAFSK
jgi:hypothetical protein